MHPICDLQIEYSLISRGVEAAIIPALAELGVGMTAYGVLSRGLLSGSKGGTPRRQPRTRAAVRGRERRRPTGSSRPRARRRLAAARGVSAAQLAIAWVRARAAAQHVTVVPTLGARTPKQLDDALAGVALALTAAEVAEIEAAVPASAVAGDRYPAPMMKTLDSERS